MNGAHRSSPTQNKIGGASANPNPPRAKREYPSIANRRSSDGSEPAGTSIDRSKRSGLPHEAISWIDEVSIELDGNWSELHTRAADSVRKRSCCCFPKDRADGGPKAPTCQYHEKL
ncbi:hypothetical protein NL676_017960 [Syzygium grande]|nr:hypothetical protein NL676_017960 [Syzygium grande]